MNIKTRPFTQDEFRLLCLYSPDPWKAIFQIAYFTGLRVSDILSLKNEPCPPTLVVIEKKTGKKKSISVSPSLVEAWDRLRRFSKNDGFLSPFRDISSYRKAVCRYCVKAMIPLDRVAFHSIRKTTATVIYQNLGFVAASAFLNHSKLSTTLSYIDEESVKVSGVLEASQHLKSNDPGRTK